MASQILKNVQSGTKKNYVRWVNVSKSALQKKDVIQKLKMLKTRLDLCTDI